MTGDGNQGIVISGGSLNAKQVVTGQNARGALNEFGPGSNVNFGSHVTGTSQTATQAEDQCAIQSLLEDLTKTLKAAPAIHSAEAEALTGQAQQLVDVAIREQPNPRLLEAMVNGVKATASLLKDTVPDAATIVTQIASIAGRLADIAG